MPWTIVLFIKSGVFNIQLTALRDTISTNEIMLHLDWLNSVYVHVCTCVCVCDAWHAIPSIIRTYREDLSIHYFIIITFQK